MSFTNFSSTDGKIVVFSRDLVEGTLTLTIKVIPTWWEFHEHPVVLASTTAQAISGLSSTATEIPDLTMANNREFLLIDFIASLQFLHPLLMATYLSLSLAYMLLTAQEEALL